MKMDFKPYEKAIANLAKKHDLDFVALFGSQATGAVHAKSDVDIGIIRREKISFDEKMKILGEFYDIFKRDDVEVVDFDNVSPTLMREVVEEGKLLYEKEEGIFLNWKIYAIKIWLETKWLRDLRDKSLIRWASELS